MHPTHCASSGARGRAKIERMIVDELAASHRVAEFCSALPQLRTMAVRQGWSGRLRGVVATLRADPADAIGALDTLWSFLELDASVGRGVDLDIGRIGVIPTPPPDGAYVCPREVCVRLYRRAPAEPVPACEVFGVSMVWQR